MLLVSSITPSGRIWAQEAAERSVPGIGFVDSLESDPPVASDLAGIFEVAGLASPAVLSGMTSMRSVAMLCSLLHRYGEVSTSCAALFPGSVAAAVADAQTLGLLIDAPGADVPDTPGANRLRATAAAISSGELEWLLICPPEKSALSSAVGEVAVATAAGLRVRGVAVCPMPRKVDGWPKSIRQRARGNADELEQVLHPIPVGRARRGMAPAFVEAGREICDESVVQQTDGTWVWSITIPGFAQCDVSAGTWTNDAAYPTTHVVLDIDGRIVYRAVNSIVRRCEAIEAVLCGDSLAITFEPHVDQWPNAGQEDGA